MHSLFICVANLFLTEFINLNLQGESSLTLDTAGPVGFDGSFVGFDSPAFVNVTGGANGYLATSDTFSLSGETLSIDALRFTLDSGGDMFINTDSSIHGSANRVGMNSLSHTALRVFV